MINTVVTYLLKNKFFDIEVFKGTKIDFDFIIIATALSQKHIKITSLRCVKYIKYKYNLDYVIVSGYDTGWVVIDFNTLLVHIMLKDIKDLYNLNELYSK